jgi:N-acetylneuraminate synthase
MQVFEINGRKIGPGERCFLVGEVAQAHEGSLGMAHAYIDAISEAGADAVKFQTHIADAESTLLEPWRVKFSLQDDTRYNYWKRMEFTEEQWIGLKRHSEQKGLLFLSSPFSIEAVELLERLGVAAWKIASGEITNSPMIERIFDNKLPIMLSTGMSRIEEIDFVVDKIKSAGIPMAVLQCSTAYPCPAEKVGINLIQFFRERYDCPSGLSDHSGKIFPGLAAVTLGADIIEVHATLNRKMFGPDVSSSVTVSELRQLSEGIRFIERMCSNQLNKNAIADEFRPLRNFFTKSIVAKRKLRAGTVLTKNDLTVKKPGTGIPASEINCFIGRRLLRDIEMDDFLREDFLE